MREQDSRVPPEVEHYLIELIARAGQVGGGVGGALGTGGLGGRRGQRGGARGGALAARWVGTGVEDRPGVTARSRPQLEPALRSAFPRATELPAVDTLIRLAIPVRRLALDQVVVDINVAPSAGQEDQLTNPLARDAVAVRAYYKGRADRRLAVRLADQVAALTNEDAP